MAKDNCRSCNGDRGGVPGNGNIVGGVLLCDYCLADILEVMRQARALSQRLALLSPAQFQAASAHYGADWLKLG